jgi:autotransporter-associated beta strand protein
MVMRRFGSYRRMLLIAACCVGALAVLPAAAFAAAEPMTISSSATSNVTFDAGTDTYTPIGAGANLSVTDLDNELASSAVQIGTTATTSTITVDNPISSISGSALSFAPATSISIGTGAIATGGSQSYEAPVTETAGTTITSSLGSISYTSSSNGGTTQALTLNAAGTVTLGGSLTSAALSITGSGIDLNGGTVMTVGGLFLNAPVTLGADTALTNAGGSIFTRAIDGAHTLSVENDGGISLAGSIGSTTPLTSFSVTDATGEVDDFGNVTTSGDQTYGTTPLTLQNAVVLSSSSGQITSSAGQSLDHDLTISGAGTLSGVVSGSAELIKQGPGILTLSASNTYQGATIVDGGLVNFASGLALGSGNVTLNGGGLQWGPATNVDISSRLNAIGSGGATFDTNGKNVSLGTALTGSGPITKSGAGTLTLAATNTDDAATDVTAGTLDVTGTLPGAVTAENGATVDVSGTVDGSATVQPSGTLACSGGTLAGGVTNHGGTATSVPDAPTAATAVAGDATVTIGFTPGAPNCLPVSYTATALPGGAHASGAGSPITVTGLTNNTTYTFSVTATNPIGSASVITPAVTPESPAPPLGVPVNQVPPVASGTARAGHALSCTTGTWSGAPSSYAYQWLRNGNLIAGASRPSYTVAAGDEGSSLACVVVAANATGAGAPALSHGIAVPIVATRGCPAATGTIHGSHLGPVTLGIARATAQRDFPKSSRRGKRYEQFFCLTPVGIRVVYGSPHLLAPRAAKARSRYLNRVVLASTSSPTYVIDGIRPGSSLAAARRALHGGNTFVIGANTWYVAARGSVTAVLKTRDGVVQEIGIAAPSITRSRTQRLRLVKSIY